MIVAKVYGLLWLLAAALGTGLYVTGSFDMTSTVLFGFFVSVLAGAALLVVFPAIMSERVTPATTRNLKVSR
jgi:hypothetical protein